MYNLAKRIEIWLDDGPILYEFKDALIVDFDNREFLTISTASGNFVIPWKHIVSVSYCGWDTLTNTEATKVIEDNNKLQKERRNENV